MPKQSITRKKTTMFTLQSRTEGTMRFVSFLNGEEEHYDLYRTPSPTFTHQFRKETSYGSTPDGSTSVRLADTMEGFCNMVADKKAAGFKVEHNKFDHLSKDIVFWVEKDVQEVEFDVNFRDFRNDVPHFVGKGSQYRYKFIAHWDSLSPADFKVLTNLIASL